MCCVLHTVFFFSFLGLINLMGISFNHEEWEEREEETGMVTEKMWHHSTVFCRSQVELLIFPHSCRCCLVIKSCLTLCNPMDCGPLGSSVYGILQARILKWVDISFSRVSSWPRDWIVSLTLVDKFFTTEQEESPIFPYT